VIKKAGTAAQEAPRRFFDVREPIPCRIKSGSLLVLLPDDKFRVSCTQQDQTIALPNFSQPKFHRHSTNAKLRRPALCFYEEVAPLMEKNLIKGGSLEKRHCCSG